MTVHELPLPSLVGECLRGRQTAFTELVRRYQGMVFGLCMRMLRHREEAEDATQEAFLRISRNLHRWDPDRSFEPWIMAIAGNRCRTRLAVRGRRGQTISLEEPVADSTHLEADACHLAEEVDRILEGLRPESRRAFELFYREERPYADIAIELGVPLGTVKTWVHRTRKELLEQLRARGTLSV